MDLSIVIVNWNTKELLSKCLISIYDTVQGLPFEVIVVDNASTDSSVGFVQEQFPQVRLIVNTENLGFAKANNQGIRTSNSRFILFLNSDTLSLPNSINRMVAFLNKNQEVGLIGCQLLNDDGSFQSSWADYPGLISASFSKDFHLHVRAYESKNGNEKAIEVDAVSGACMLVRREVLETVGVLDENYLLFCEEIDWCYRIRQAGWLICSLPHIHIIHHLGKSRANLQMYAYQQLHRSRLLFFRKHYGLWRARLLKLEMQLALLGKLSHTYISTRLQSGSHEENFQKLNAQIKLWQWLLDIRIVSLSHENCI